MVLADEVSTLILSHEVRCSKNDIPAYNTLLVPFLSQVFLLLVMAALCNRGAIIFLPCDFYLSIFYLLLLFFLA